MQSTTEKQIQLFNAALTCEKSDNVILADVSGSMSQIVLSAGKSKMMVMRDALLRTVSTVTDAAVLLFGRRVSRLLTWDSFLSLAYSLGATTNLAAGLCEARRLNPSQIVVITDGCPNNQTMALEVARTMLCRIDVFYIGNGNASEVDFCRQLAQFGGEAIIDPTCVTMIGTETLFLTERAIAA